MSTRTKSLLFYIGGVITGIILTAAFFFIVAIRNNEDLNNNLVMFDKPRQEITIKSLRVMQVLPDGSALATAYDLDDTSTMGTVVMFPASNKTAYYDDQKIRIPKSKCLMQIGTYKYMTRNDIEKTVPVVEIMDR